VQGYPPPPPPQPTGPEQLLAILEGEGVRVGLARHWSKLEALQEEARFSHAQIAWIFAQASRLPAMDQRKTMMDANAPLPLSTRLVQLFSNHICERIPELTPDQITTYVVALTSPALPMDEFWLFMLAKRIQDTVPSFRPEEVVTIARRYADKALEDDEFFEALASHVASSLNDFSLPQVSGFLLSCAKIRFLSEDLCERALPLFESHAHVAALGGDAVGNAFTAAALLDQRTFRALACCRRLASHPAELRRALASTDLVLGMVIAAVYLQHPGSVQMLLPPLLEHVAKAYAGRARIGRRGRSEAAMVRRRLTMVAQCAAFGIPRPDAWSLGLIKLVVRTLEGLEQLEAAGGRDLWEPSPSSFHLEVVAVLRLLDTEHAVEQRQSPFVLDIKILPEQLEHAQRCWEASVLAQ